MLKKRENEFTQLSDMIVFLGTWNVNGKKPGESLEQWLFCKDIKPDIYAIGFQELDLTAEALLLGDTSRSAPWEAAIQSTLKLLGDYVLLMMKQLVGILLCVYVKREHLDRVSDVQSGLAAVGIMGMMGNKGGVAVRFNIADSSICILNSHLNAHVDNVARRNQDYKDICRRILFQNEEEAPISIFDHDFLFWLGDLNYRLTASDYEVRTKINLRDYDFLLTQDQLKQQMKTGQAFENFCEAPIRFAPTYKYDVHSTTYDSSEKHRIPAWCDRVLWRCQDEKHLQSLGYNRHELLTSDHRPVSSIFRIKVKTTIPPARSKVYQELLKQLDMMENECMPDARISTPDGVRGMDFGEIRYLVTESKPLTIENIGQVMAKFRFIPKLDERRICKPWIWVTPTTGLLLPGEQITIKLTIYVDDSTAQDLNIGKDSLEDVLIIHLEKGKDFFVSVTGHYLRTCFGNTLDYLVRFPHPIRSSRPLDQTTTSIPTLGKTEENSRDTIKTERLAIPKELWRIVDFIYRRGMEEDGLFLQSGGTEMDSIRECLDTGESCAGKNFSVHSMAETLLRFLESLAVPVIPFDLYNQCLEASHSYTICKQIISGYLSTVSYNVFYYLMSFLREVLAHSPKNNLTPNKLAVIFSSVLLRLPTTPGVSSPPIPESVIKKKAGFILHFLLDSDHGK